jgi:hypothetical protein
MRSLAKVVVALVGLAMLGLLLTSTFPDRSLSSQATASGRAIVVPMVFVEPSTATERVTAEEAGNTLVSKPLSVNPKPADRTVFGDCGTSFVFLLGGKLQYTFHTGFTVNKPAVFYEWNVNVVGPRAYEREFPYGGPLLLRAQWEQTAALVPVDDSGFYDAEATGTAYFTDGSHCVSAGPSDRTTVK